MNSEKLYVLSFVKDGRPCKGAVNSKGEVIIPPNFKQIDYKSDQTELIPAGILKPNAEHALDLHWGYIDQVGEWKIKPQYQVLLAPNNNSIITKLKGEWCKLNMQGEVIEKIPVTKKVEGITPFDENDVAVAFCGDYAQLLNRQYEVIFDSKKYKVE
ncbi:WG repeat-containing protein [Leptospira mayottensis]|uniref:WG repeat-containing protein n=2 Tax=Leptospira mayottensis TaxID=1137606 RepID=A0AA87SZ34_9LEPT|nr:WG repeat-containing protein [Leptospira mayottensis]AXR64269.1 WG repeat-containing protein [Leptospira mayottensis]EKS02107.1 hypothetical protein LEP1GSC125_0814 [Leptospira mayottensis 200901122]